MTQGHDESARGGDGRREPELPQFGRMADPSQAPPGPRETGRGQTDPLQGAAWQSGRPEARQDPGRGPRPPQRRARRRGSDMAVTWVLIGACVVVYALQWLLTLIGIDPVVLLGLAPGRVSQAPWTVVTSGFAHSMGNPAHLALNMYTLWIFGRMLEPGIGRGRFLAVYLLSLLGGSSAVLLLSPALTFTVGASGAIFGLFGAVLALALWGGRHHRENLAGIVLLIVINTAFGLFVPGISWQGHLGGLVTGLVVMAALTAMRRRRA